MFKQDSPLMALLTKIGNMMLVSFFFLLTCIPILTIIPACAALFHTMTKVVRDSGEGVVKDYFSALRQSLNPGIILSLLVVLSGALLYTCVDFGWQMMRQSLAGTAYFAIGCILTLIWLSTVLYIPAALSRFEGGTGTILRIAFYLPTRNILCTILMVVLLAVMALLVDFYPVVLLLMPGLYVDLTCGGTEKALQKFVEANRPEKEPAPQEESESQQDEEPATEQPDEMSALEQAKMMDESEDK